MSPSSDISLHHQRAAVVPIESTIPPDMSIAEWRKLRASRPRPKRRRRPLALGGGGKVVPLRPDACNHLHETTTRYDHARKLLTFLLVCPTCGTEKVVETQRYEPRYEPAQPLRRAA